MDMIYGWLNGETVQMTVRLLVAALLSGLVGLEREMKRHPAGFRTHLLVGIGSCLMMLLSIFGFEAYLNAHPNIRGFDPSRLPAYVVSGIGFLGAGTILVHGVTVRGLTTAASIWVVAGIGLVVGIGMYYEAVLTTVVVILSLLFLNKFETLFVKSAKKEQLHVMVRSHKVPLTRIVQTLEEEGAHIEQVSAENVPDPEETLIKYSIMIRLPNEKTLVRIYDALYEHQHVRKVFTAD